MKVNIEKIKAAHIARRQASKDSLAVALIHHRAANPHSNYIADADYWDAMETVWDNLTETVHPDDWPDAAWDIVDRYVTDDYPKMGDCDFDFILENFENYCY